MKAEIGIDEDGRPYVALSGMSMTERSLLLYLKKHLPIEYSEEWGEAWIRGTPLPGAGKAGDA